jgi:chaperonin GroEL
MSTLGKRILFDKEARAALAAGADKLTRAVVSTLGPMSRNAVLDKEWPAPDVVHDGVTVASAIRFKDPFQDMGAQLIKEAASKTNDLAGDGTTTATLLANTILQEGLPAVDGGLAGGLMTPKVNSMILRQDLLKHADTIIKRLDEMKRLVTDPKEVAQIANISTQNPEIGALVAEAIEKVGKDGVVVVEEGDLFESSVDTQEGMEFDNGYLSPGFVTDGDRMVCEYDDVWVLLTDYTIVDPAMLTPVVIRAMKENKALLIIANDVIGPSISALVITKVDPRTQAKVVAVMAPSFADRRKEILEDIAILTGATVISQQLGMKLGDDVTPQQLGRAKKIRITQTHTVIVPSNPDSEEIQARAQAIREQIEAETVPFKKEKLQERLAKLSGSVAVVTVGGGSATEIKEKRLRVEDAIYASKAALADGIIPGGGITLMHIASEVLEKNEGSQESRDLIVKALQAPFETLMRNSGYDPDEIAPKIDWTSDTSGFDVVTGQVVDMFDAGIVDPVKVTKLAIRHAISVASSMLTTAVAITDEEDSVQKVRPVQ